MFGAFHRSRLCSEIIGYAHQSGQLFGFTIGAVRLKDKGFLIGGRVSAFCFGLFPASDVVCLYCNGPDS
jgi:hypothetical protein